MNACNLRINSYIVIIPILNLRSYRPYTTPGIKRSWRHSVTGNGRTSRTHSNVMLLSCQIPALWLASRRRYWRILHTREERGIFEDNRLLCFGTNEKLFFRFKKVFSLLKKENMENFEHNADDHLFEKELIRMCIEQLLDEDDERETSTDEIYSQKAKNHHFNSPNYQVIGQKPPRDSHHGKTNSYATVLSGNFKNNLVRYYMHARLFCFCIFQCLSMSMPLSGWCWFFQHI